MTSVSALHAMQGLHHDRGFTAPCARTGAAGDDGLRRQCGCRNRRRRCRCDRQQACGRRIARQLHDNYFRDAGGYDAGRPDSTTGGNQRRTTSRHLCGASHRCRAGHKAARSALPRSLRAERGNLARPRCLIPSRHLTSRPTAVHTSCPNARERKRCAPSGRGAPGALRPSVNGTGGRIPTSTPDTAARQPPPSAGNCRGRQQPVTRIHVGGGTVNHCLRGMQLVDH